MRGARGRAPARPCRRGADASAHRAACGLSAYGNPIQNIYINEVKLVDGKMLNVAIAKVENVSQFGPYDAKTYLADPPDSRDFPPGKCSDPYYKK